ncbi:thioesterase II family protein [Streptomyces cacaoi]|uniref:thioesterase II family protein n=1 Tax=Streptomyces cacaoi TaxID=1898 RepID=UPI0011F1EC15|nr:thioesterase domain-containing protein [Streptomyces cacaoi]
MAPPVTSASRWFRRFRPRPDAEVALVRLPHAGGSASSCFSLSQRLSASADVLAEVRQLSGTDPQVLDGPDLVGPALPTPRADHTAAGTYAPGPGAVVHCDVVALTGGHDEHVGPADAEAWRHHTTGDFALHVFDGGLFSLDAHEPRIAETVATGLHAAARSRPDSRGPGAEPQHPVPAPQRRTAEHRTAERR